MRLCLYTALRLACAYLWNWVYREKHKREVVYKLIILFVLIAGQALANLEYLPGSIPLEYKRRPSTDLVYKGKRLLPAQVDTLYNQGLDISTLNPYQSDIWSDTLGNDLNDSEDLINGNTTTELNYISNISSRLENFRFTVSQRSKSGEVKHYVILVSKNSHSFLLRKNILRKLGYIVPKIQYVPKVNIKFKGSFSKKIFLEDLTDQTFGVSDRWVLNPKDTSSKIVELQDVLMLEVNEPIYNLAMGYMPSQIIQGRRVFNSLLIPYALVNVRESINGLSWQLGKIYNNFVLLNTDHSEEFAPTYHDALWMLKRLERLDRSDFEDIVAKSYYPEAVSKVLVEKLISRRNTVLKLFKFKNSKIKFNSKIDHGDELYNGVLTKQWWDGYGSRFSYDLPDSPLSSSEIAAFFKSKLISTAIDGLVFKLNDLIIPTTDIAKKVQGKQIEAAQDQLNNFINTGEFKKIPFGIFAIPTFDGNISVSREIFAGSYLGTDNMIQLADNFDVSIGAGVFLSATGVPASLQVFVDTKVDLSRTYSHIKPIKSIKKAIKEPYKNLLVNLVKRKNGNLFNYFTTEEFNNLPSDQKQEKIDEIMNGFFEGLEVGESFIITDNIAKSLSGGAAYEITNDLKAQAALYGSKVALSRLHITRSDKNTIQVYKGRGKAAILGLSLGIEAFGPIINFQVQKSSGDAHTKFYSLDMNTELSENANIVKNALALREVFVKNNLEYLTSLQQPYEIRHKFKEDSQDFSFLYFKSAYLKQADKISITHPNGYEKIFHRRSSGKRKGKDYQGLSVDILNAIIEEGLDTDFSVPNTGSGNPADTFKGSSTLREIRAEVEQKDTGLDDSFIDINYRWAGWKAKRSKIDKLIEDINNKFGDILFPEEVLKDTEFLELYSIDVNIYLYDNALEYLYTLSDADFLNFLNKYLYIKYPPMKINESQRHYERRLIRMKKRILKKLNDKRKGLTYALSSEDFTKNSIGLINILENSLELSRFIEIIGGEDNLFIFGRITGFRGGVEDGDEAIISNSLGKIGAVKARGGLKSIQGNMGISESELLLYWLLRRL